MQEDDDEVIQEIPVFSTRSLAGKLYVYQYPNEVGDLETAPVMSASIKLAHREVNLEVALDTESNNYDSHKGESIAREANGEPPVDPKKPHDKYFRRNIMDRIKLHSRLALPDVSNFVVGVLHQNELHITPVQAIMDLRKTLSYLDQADKQARSRDKELGLAENSGDEEEEAKQVTVKFARQDNDRYKQAKQRSFHYLSKKSAEEPWFHTQFHGFHTQQAKSERQRLFACTHTTSAIHVHCPGSSIEQQIALLDLGAGDQGPQGDDPLSIHDFQQLASLQDRIKCLLAEVKLIQFSRLLRLLALEADAVNALRVVQQCAVLVRGNWAARSDVLYKKVNVKPVVGEVPPQLMCHARDYILYLFTQQHSVDRLSVSDMVKVPADIVGTILSSIARVGPDRSWELLLPTDDDFIGRHPEVVQRQQLQWESKHKQLSEAFRDQPPTKTRRKSNRDSSVSDSDALADVPKRKHRRKSVGLSSDESGTEQRSRKKNKADAKES